jgi:hypothetical protein
MFQGLLFTHPDDIAFVHSQKAKRGSLSLWIVSLVECWRSFLWSVLLLVYRGCVRRRKGRKSGLMRLTDLRCQNHLRTVRVAADSIPLAILELKDSALDPFDAFCQAVASGSNGVLRQLNAGLAWDDCRVFIICCNGGKYLFGFVSLLEPHFIQAGVISPVLDVCSAPALEEIARLLVLVRRGCVVQRQILSEVRATKEVVSTSKISWDMYHLKPSERVLLQHENRDYASGWYRFLQIYDRIFACVEIRSCVVFPIGFYKNVSSKFKGVTFHRLKNDWNIGLPIESNCE